MTNEEFQKLVLEKLVSLDQGQKSLEQGQKSLESEVSLIKANMATKEDIVKLEQRFDQLDEKLEKDIHHTMKLTYDKIESIETKFDDRLDNIETDVTYLVAKSARYRNEIDKLKNTRKAKNSL